MDFILRIGIVVVLIILGLVSNLIVVIGLWPLCQTRSAFPVPGFSRTPAPVLDRLIAATIVAALFLTILTGIAQLPVLAFDWCPHDVWGVRGQCYGQNIVRNYSWMDAAIACEEQGGTLAGFPHGTFPYLIPNLETGRFWVGVMDDGIPRPSCRNIPPKGKPASNRCLKIDEGCPQIVIQSSRNVSVHSSSCNVQAGYICNLGPMIVIPGFCQVQGLITSFLTPLVLCYLSLISIERFLHHMIPEEHDLTFSWLNTSVIQVGVMFLLVTDATGPVYGWAQYVFSSESGLCILDPGSRYVTTYISVSLPLYYFLPLIATICSHSLILLQKSTYQEEDEYPFPSRVIPSGRRGQVLLCVSCVLPFLGRLPSVLALVICSSKLNSFDPMKSEQEDDDIDIICREGKLDFFLVWFKFFSVTSLFPILLLLGSPNLRKHVKVCFTKKVSLPLCKWRRTAANCETAVELSERGKLQQSNQNTTRTQSPVEEIVEIV